MQERARDILGITLWSGYPSVVAISYDTCDGNPLLSEQLPENRAVVGNASARTCAPSSQRSTVLPGPNSTRRSCNHTQSFRDVPGNHIVVGIAWRSHRPKLLYESWKCDCEISAPADAKRSICTSAENEPFGSVHGPPLHLSSQSVSHRNGLGIKLWWRFACVFHAFFMRFLCVYVLAGERHLRSSQVSFQ